MIPRRLLEHSPELGVHLCLRRLELGPSHSQLIVHCTGIDQSVNKGHALSQSIQELSLVSLWKLINPLGKYYVVDTHISIHLILSWSNRRLCYWLTLHALCHKNRLWRSHSEISLRRDSTHVLPKLRVMSLRKAVIPIRTNSSLWTPFLVLTLPDWWTQSDLPDFSQAFIIGLLWVHLCLPLSKIFMSPNPDFLKKNVVHSLHQA